MSVGFSSVPYAPVSATVLRPSITFGSFVLDGATDPSQFGGAIESVRRLEEAADPFFRVRFTHPIARIPATNLRPLESFLNMTVHDPAGQTQVTASESNRTDDGGDVRDDLRELDFTVISDGDVVVDTAGFRVDFLYLFTQSAPRK